MADYEINENFEKWLSYNAKLQKKKNKLRAKLKEKGMLQKKGNNAYDHYNYFSEAQYKLLFTELLSESNLELSFSEVDYAMVEGTKNQSNGRIVKLEFTLTDCETGFSEKTLISGEGIDKGDKAGYKAYTGALKYYLADTFLVATGDDPEKDSPDQKMNNRATRSRATTTKPAPAPAPAKSCTKEQAAEIDRLVDDKESMLAYYKVAKVEELTEAQAQAIIDGMKRKKGES